MTLIIR